MELYITVSKVEISAKFLRIGVSGAEYRQALAAIGTEPIIWSIVRGDLPEGLALSADGIISGTPKATGTFIFTVRAENDVGDDIKEFRIRIVKDISRSRAAVVVLIAGGLLLLTAIFIASKRDIIRWAEW
jgi:hypothetical protein